MPDSRKLNVVDERGNVLGEDTREHIHRNGLLHREIHVWFYTPRGEIIFQHRAADKDTNPNLLDATVGGHVEIGSDYLPTALREVAEETGLRIDERELKFVRMLRSNTYDLKTQTTNNVLRAIYAYCYRGDIHELNIEAGKAMGFEAWPLRGMFNLSAEDQRRFIPSLLNADSLTTFHAIEKLANE